MATAAAPAVTATSGPLRNSKFRLWWAGSAISLFGDQFYIVALPWLVLQITGSSIALGMILMAASLPRAVLMLIGGAATDRTSPRKIMIATAAARTIFVGAIAALVYLHFLRIWQLYFLAFGFGVADAFYMPASMTFLGSLVEKEQLVAANSVSQSTTLLVTIAGPAPAGITVKAIGAAWALLLDAVSFLFVIGALWKLSDPPKAQTMTKPGLWGFHRRRPQIRKQGRCAALADAGFRRAKSLHGRGQSQWGWLTLQNRGSLHQPRMVFVCRRWRRALWQAL